MQCNKGHILCSMQVLAIQFRLAVADRATVHFLLDGPLCRTATPPPPRPPPFFRSALPPPSFPPSDPIADLTLISPTLPTPTHLVFGNRAAATPKKNEMPILTRYLQRCRCGKREEGADRISVPFTKKRGPFVDRSIDRSSLLRFLV